MASQRLNHVAKSPDCLTFARRVGGCVYGLPATCSPLSGKGPGCSEGWHQHRAERALPVVGLAAASASPTFTTPVLHGAVRNWWVAGAVQTHGWLHLWLTRCVPSMRFEMDRLMVEKVVASSLSLSEWKRSVRVGVLLSGFDGLLEDVKLWLRRAHLPETSVSAIAQARRSCRFNAEVSAVAALPTCTEA
ncbi:unnamed protein product [Ostreobium quekettii]|uniref:Uncharacterized protein n=1 Tax=Ostreobium quekettii TaxID=121088 RepID=A0A8S1ISG1_9CHLO|nr:unnamed protein product [Ostreobium quekettii]